MGCRNPNNFNCFWNLYISRRWQAPGAVKIEKKSKKKSEKKSEKKSKKSCQCLYMFFMTQSKKSNLRRGLNHVPINQIV